MNRFEQRLNKRMRDPEFADGYREMTSELQRLDDIKKIRVAQHLSKKARDRVSFACERRV